MEGIDWSRVLSVRDMVGTLEDGGWTAEDRKEYIGRLKTEGFKDLDAFAGGELSNAKGSPVYGVLLNTTAIRYAMETAGFSTGIIAPPECPHGFRMRACNRCLKAEPGEVA